MQFEKNAHKTMKICAKMRSHELKTRAHMFVSNCISSNRVKYISVFAQPDLIKDNKDYKENLHGLCWHKRVAFQLVGIWAVDWQHHLWPLKTSLFLYFFPFLLRCDLFSLIEGVLG